MILPDANVLLHAFDSRSDRHAKARTWLEALLSGTEPVGFSWMTLLAFVRIGTNPRAFRQPLSVREAVGFVEGWLEQPCAQIVEPLEGHWRLTAKLITDGHAPGALVMDAHLAAMAIERGATVQSTDADFARFRGVRAINPLADPA